MDGNHRIFRYQGRDALELPARREDFAVLKAWLQQVADDMHLPQKTGRQLLIAADEIFTNIASYSYPETAGTVSVALEFSPDEAVLSVTFRDRGVAYNPLEAPPPELGGGLDSRVPGGLGIFMAKKMTDGMAYRREDGCNVLTLTKRCPAGEENG